MLVNQVMNIVLLCLYLFCENHFILFVSVLSILFYFVCTCSEVLLFCFHVVSGQWRGATTTFDSAVAVPSLSKIQMIIWSSNQFCCCCITCPRQTAFELMFAWIRKGYGNPDRVSFWLGLHFLRTAQCTLTRETSCDPAPPAQRCGSSCKHPPSIALLVIFSQGLFINLNMSLMLACLRTPDLITVLFFFGVLAKYLLWKCKCNIFLIANKLITTSYSRTIACLWASDI